MISNSSSGIRRGPITLSIALFLTVILLAAACGAGIFALAQRAGGVVAVVNGHKIRKQDLYEAMYGRAGAAALEQLVVEVLVQEEARKAGVSVSDSELEEEIERVIEEQYGSVELFDATLQYYGMTREGFEREWRTYLLAKRILEPTLSVSEEEIRSYFDEHREELNQKESVTVRQIVTKTRDEALDVIDQLVAGKDFAELAREKSIDLSTSQRGGEMGTVYRGELPAQIESVVFALKAGEWSEPVQTDLGFAVFNVTSRTEAREVTLDEVRDRAKSLVLDEKVQTALPGWISDLRSKADVRYR